jgi:hypothetical protein
MPVCDPFRQQYRQDLIENLKSSFSYLSDSYWLLGIGKISPWLSSTGAEQDNVPPQNVDCVKSDTDFWRDAFAFKKIGANDVSLVVARNDWEVGQVYDAYRDDVDLYDDTSPSKFYVLVDEERVYKCIDNNYGAASQVAPTHTDYQIRTLSDGYRWKYLYSITDSSRKFLTKSSAGILGYMPVEFLTSINENDERVSQWDVQNAAVNGSIDYISLDENLKNNIISTKVVFSASENQVAAAVTAGSSTVIIAGPNLVLSNNYYNNYVLKIDSGNGAGQQRIITSYVAGSNTATLTLDSPLDVGLTSGTGSDASLYSIYPYVKIVGDGSSYNNSLYTQSTSAIANVVFASGSTGVTGAKYIDSIELVDTGQDYTYANVSIISGLTFAPGITGDLSQLATAVMSPIGGHGSNPVKELGAAGIMISTDLNQSESNNITIENDYRQFCLIKNAKLNNPRARLMLSYSGISGSFTVGATVTQGLTGVDGNTLYDASGKITEWNPGPLGTTGTAELILSNINKTFAVGGIINGITSFNITEIKQNVYAGQELRLTQRLKLSPFSTVFATGTEFTKGYYSIGIGNTSSNISKSRSTGRIYNWDVENGTNSVGNLYLEYVNGIPTIGEYVSQISPDFISLTGFTPIGKIIEIDEDQDLTDVVYDQTTQLNLNYDGSVVFNSSSFDLDANVSSLSGGNTVGTGRVIDWSTGGTGTTGYLRILGTTGSFSVGNKILYNNSSTTGASISSIISTPDILYHSGEIMYIQNIRPITRSIEQKEEIKLIIQF